MNTFAKRLLAVAICAVSIALPACFMLSGCNTTDARRAGRLSTATALLVEDFDPVVLQEAKARIDAYLASGQPITDAAIDAFTAWLARRLDRNPGAVRLVVSELKDWVLQPVEIPPGQIEPARAFVQGVSDALGIAFPSTVTENPIQP